MYIKKSKLLGFYTIFFKIKMYSSADFSGSFRLKGKSRKMSDVMASTTQFHLIQLTSRQHRRCIIPQAVNTV